MTVGREVENDVPHKFEQMEAKEEKYIDKLTA